MRITGGKARGILLKVPKNVEIRPSTDTNRQRIFNRIGTDIQGAVVWDCFAGTGAFGLEALSHGAEKTVFFEKNPITAAQLKKNAEAVCKSACLEVEECTKVVTIDAFVADFSVFPQPNFIFFDPPYRFWEEKPEKLNNVLADIGTLFPTATLVLGFPSQLIWANEHPWQPMRSLTTSKQMNEPRIELFRTRNFKD